MVLACNIHCWGVNVPDIHIETLRSRWSIIDPISALPQSPTADALVFPEEEFHSFPCLDNSNEFHLISRDLLHLSSGLKGMFEGDPKSNKRQFSTLALLRYLKAKGLVTRTFDTKQLEKLLHKHSHIFRCDTNRWTASLHLSALLKSAEKTLITQFETILDKTRSVYPWPGKRSKEPIFELPSTGKLLKKYIWTYNMLQVGTHTEEIARRLKNAIDTYYFRKEGLELTEIGALICATAPARILAEALAKQYNIQPPVFDLGAINDLDPDEIASSFKQDNVESCIIVTDVLDTKTLITRLIELVEMQGVKVKAVASIIRFIDKESNTNRWFSSVVEQNLDITSSGDVSFFEERTISETKSYPMAILYDYPSPTSLSDVLDATKHDHYWIEPYSLGPLRVEPLVRAFHAWEHEERQKGVPHRICLLDRKRYIRYGHFKNRSHHNRILIHMPGALQDIEVADEICDDIVDFIRKHPPDVIVVPLHSSINYLVPYLNTRLREESLYRPVICTIAVDLKGRGPWYLLPQEARSILLELGKPGSIMFLDDAMLSGRTVETILRAIDIFLQENISRDQTPKMKEISVYVIVNRIGRAASTKWRQTGVLSGCAFNYEDFVRFESPVYTSHDCPMCRDRNRLREYKMAEDVEQSCLAQWVDDETTKLDAIATSTQTHKNKLADRLFEEEIEHDLPNQFLLIVDPPCAKGSFHSREELRLQTLDGALWWFWERGYRGSPPLFLLNKFMLWFDSEQGLATSVKEPLLTEVLLWALDNISSLRLKTIPGEPTPQKPTHVFFELLKRFFDHSGANIPRVLEKAGFILMNRVDDRRSTLLLRKIFSFCIKYIVQSDDVDVVASITLGLEFIIIRSRMNHCLESLYTVTQKDINKEITDNPKWSGFLKSLLMMFASEVSQNDFLYSLNILLKERHKRKHGELFKVALPVFPSTPLKNYKHLVYTFQVFGQALDTLFSIADDDTSLQKEIQRLKRFFKKTIAMIEKNDRNHDAFVTNLKIISDHFWGDSQIGSALDYHNSLVYDAIKELNREHPTYAKHIAYDLRNDDKVRILGYKHELKELLKNHCWDVIKKWGSNHPEINIRIMETERHIIINIYNRLDHSNRGHHEG